MNGMGVAFGVSENFMLNLEFNHWDEMIKAGVTDGIKVIVIFNGVGVCKISNGAVLVGVDIQFFNSKVKGYIVH